MNVIWICIGVSGLRSPILSLVCFCCTIVGIPFGMQHFKLTRLALFYLKVFLNPNLFSFHSHRHIAQAHLMRRTESLTLLEGTANELLC